MSITQPTEDGTASPPLSPLPIRLLHQSSTRSYMPLRLRFGNGRKRKRRNFADAITDRAHNLKSVYAYSDWDSVEKIDEEKRSEKMRKNDILRHNKNEDLNTINFFDKIK